MPRAIRSAAAATIEPLEQRALLSVANGGFESGMLNPWTFTGPTFSEGLVTSSGYGITPYEGNYFAVLTPSAPPPSGSAARIAQTITVAAGDRITGFAYFTTTELSTSTFYNDSARVSVLSGSTELAAPFTASVLNHTNGWLTWSHTFTLAGTYTIAASIINAGDASPNSHIGIDAVTLIPGNVPPVAVADAFVTDEDTAFMGSVLANDTDADGDALEALLESGPAHGTLDFHADGMFTYTPDANYNGPDSFTYVARDTKGALSDVATVAIDVTPVNDAPVLTFIDVPAAIDEGGTLQFTASATDVDAGQALSFRLEGTPTGASIDPVTGAFSWMPGDNGTFTFDVIVSDDDAASPLSAKQRLTIVVDNVDPVAAILGAPASSLEGTAISLGSMVSDAGTADTHTYAWSVTKDGVAYAGGGGGTIDFTPDDNGLYAVTLFVADDDGGWGSTMTAIAVENVAPSASIGSPGSGSGGTPVWISGEPISLSGSAIDPGTADTLTYAWTVTRDGSPFASGAGTDFSFTPDDAGEYVVHFTATDDDGDSGADSTSLDVIALPVSVQAAVSPPAIDEDDFVTLTGAVSGGTGIGVYDVVIDWGDGTSSTLHTTDGTFAAPHRYLDDDADDHYAVIVTSYDAVGRSGSATADAVVQNAAPVVQLTNFTSGAVHSVGTSVNLSGQFTDAGTLDTHTASFLITSPDLAEPISVPAVVHADGTVSASHTFASSGIYYVSLMVIDDDGGMGTASMVGGAEAVLLIADTTEGKVLGGGWFYSEAGSYADDPTLSGLAYFTCVAMYEEGESSPRGHTTFRFADMLFRSDGYDSLVINGGRATMQGVGTINGSGQYSFRITAIDGNSTGTADRIRVKIWNLETGAVVYDNNMGAADDTAPTTALEGGNIVVKA